MNRLIYHSEESYDSGASPFDRAIRETADSEKVWIVCPYISPTYLKSLLRDVDEWRILTDVEAWVGTFHGESREEIKRLIEKNHQQIHHFGNTHAKVILSEDSAVIGSVNLTKKGIRRRTEMGIQFDEEEKITELREWFSRLWSESGPVDVEELDELVRTSTTSTHSGTTVSLSSDAPRVNASFVEDIEPPTRETVEMDEEGHEALVSRVQLAPSRKWANAFFGLLNDLIGATGLSEDDSSLVTSIAQNDRIAVSINNRYVFGAFFSGTPTTGFILGDEAENIDDLIEIADEYMAFSALSGEDEDGTPHWVEYEGEPERMVTQLFRREWMKAVYAELERASASPYQDSHEPLVYQAAVDEGYRNRVLSEAFTGDS